MQITMRSPQPNGFYVVTVVVVVVVVVFVNVDGV